MSSEEIEVDAKTEIDEEIEGNGDDSQAKKPRTRFSRIVRWPFQGIIRTIGTVIVILLLLGFTALNIYTADMARDNLYLDQHTDYEFIPETFGFNYTNISFLTADDILIHGWWLPVTNSSGPLAGWTVVLVHGFGANQGGLLDKWGPTLHDAGASMLTFDVRNHGISEDDPTGQISYGVHESNDAIAAVQYATTQLAAEIDPDRIVILGESMGGATTLMALPAIQSQVAGVILDSPLVDLRLQGYEKGKADGNPAPVVAVALFWFDVFADGWELDDVDGAAVNEGVLVPMLVFHCENDGRVVLENSLRLQEAYDGDFTLVQQECSTRIKDDAHVAMYAEPGYNETLVSWIGNLTSP